MGETFRLPLIPVFLIYVVGLYLGRLNVPFPRHLLLFTLPGLLAVWILLITLQKARWGSGVASVFFFLLGIFSIQTYLHPPFSPSHISHFAGGEMLALEGTIDRSPRRTPEGVQLLIRSQQVIVSDRHFPVDGYVLFFLKAGGNPLRIGDRLRFQCRLYRPHGFHNPGGFSYERHLAFERIYAVGFPVEDGGWVKLGEGFQNPFLLWIERGRDHIRVFLEREVSSPASTVLKALVLGEQTDVPEDVSEQFVVTGIAHLLAISGDHLGIVALLTFSLFLWIMKRPEWLLLSTSVKKWAAALTLPCILLYTFIAGGGISVIRAALMVVLFFLSILFNRDRNLLHTLGLAAFVILLVAPPSLFDVSFQLSFLAVLSILYGVPRLLSALKREDPLMPEKTSWGHHFWRYLKLSLLVTAVATFGTAPFVALHFNRISPLGFLTNLLFVPWVGFLIVPLAIAASALSFFLSPLAVFLIHLAGAITSILLRVVAFFAAFPWASLFISTPTVLEIILFYLLLFSAVHLRKGKGAKALFAGLCMLLIMDAAYWNLKGYFERNLRVTFVDVGQGDSALIEFPGGETMLVDGGGLPEDRFDVGKNVVAPFLWSRKIRRIDTLVLTHPDPDHIKGLNFIASHFSIGQFWESGLRADTETYLKLEKTLTEKQVKRVFLSEGDRVPEIKGVRISILNPSRYPAEDRTRSLANNRSLVLHLQFENIGILLPGDIEKESEYGILRRGRSIKADVLKIPHHGSLSSSTPVFLERVRPGYAILTVGERNRGRLPHPEVVKRYEQLGVAIFRTDRDGAITVTTDGARIDARPFLRAGDD